MIMINNQNISFHLKKSTIWMIQHSSGFEKFSRIETLYDNKRIYKKNTAYAIKYKDVS